MATLREAAPGIVHWRGRHPTGGFEVSSYWIPAEGVLIDPLVPPDDAELDPAPTDVILTCRLHWRGSGELIERYGVRVHVPRAGLHEFADGRPVEVYDPGDMVAGGFVAHGVGVISPDESAVHHPGRRTLAIADGAVRNPLDGPLGFVRDDLIGDDPPAIQAGLRSRFAELAQELDVEHLLLAHGDPVIGDGGAALAAFAAGEG